MPGLPPAPCPPLARRIAGAAPRPDFSRKALPICKFPRQIRGLPGLPVPSPPAARLSAAGPASGFPRAGPDPPLRAAAIRPSSPPARSSRPILPPAPKVSNTQESTAAPSRPNPSASSQGIPPASQTTSPKTQPACPIAEFSCFPLHFFTGSRLPQAEPQTDYCLAIYMSTRI